MFTSLKRLFVLAALSVGLLIPATALGHDDSKSIKHNYTSVYKQCRAAAGKDACGRNIRADGVNVKGKDRAATKKDYQRSIPRLKSIRAMALAPPQQTASGHASTAHVASSGGGCSGMSAESGSLGYNNNTHAGYVGCYQISDEHYSAGGSCSGLGTDPSGQDKCAAIICQTEGAGAWTNPAGQNPCGRLGR